MGRRWRLDSHGYVVAHYFNRQTGKSVPVALHRLVAHARDGELVDHKRHDLLDCRRCALRRATPAQNSANTRRLHLLNKTSRYRGVTLHRLTGRWQAGYKHRDIFHHLGLFDTQEAAAAAYNRAAVEVWGEFAIINKLPAQKRHAQDRAA